MALYRFIGAATYSDDLPGKSLTTWGQQLDISDELAEDCIAHRHIDLVTEATFEEQGITDDELKKYRDAKFHAMATDEFKAKKLALAKAAQEHRAQLLKPATT